MSATMEEMTQAMLWLSATEEGDGAGRDGAGGDGAGGRGSEAALLAPLMGVGREAAAAGLRDAEGRPAYVRESDGPGGYSVCAGFDPARPSAEARVVPWPGQGGRAGARAVRISSVGRLSPSGQMRPGGGPEAGGRRGGTGGMPSMDAAVSFGEAAVPEAAQWLRKLLVRMADAGRTRAARDLEAAAATVSADLGNSLRAAARDHGVSEHAILSRITGADGGAARGPAGHGRGAGG